METDRLSQGWGGAGGGNRHHSLSEKKPPPGAGSGAAHPSHRSRPSATVARLTIPRLRHQHRTVRYCRGCLLPGPRPSRTGDTRHQSPRRAVALPVRELLRQRRLASLRHPRSQPLPVDRTTHPPGRTTDQRQHCPHPTVQTARKNRQPRTKTDPAPTHPMAMGQHLPHRPSQRPPPTATLLTPHTPHQTNHQQNVSHRFRSSPRAPDPPEHPKKPAEPRQNLTHPHKTTPRHTPQPQNPHITTTAHPKRWI